MGQRRRTCTPVLARVRLVRLRLVRPRAAAPIWLMLMRCTLARIISGCCTRTRGNVCVWGGGCRGAWCCWLRQDEPVLMKPALT